MDNDLRVGVLLPTGRAQMGDGRDARVLIDMAREVEGLGFASLWVGDTLVGGGLDPLAVLSAMATATERVTLGTATMLPAFRHPVVAAQSIASVDRLSGGRVVLGVGAGFPGRSEPELALVDVPFRTRFTRLDETVSLWRRLWSEPRPGSFHGRLLHYDWLPPVPRPHRAGGPPIWLGGITPAALARTGRLYDGWLPYPPRVEDYVSGLAGVRAAAAEAGRSADAITPALYATTLVTPDLESGTALLEEYCLANYQRPYEVVREIQVLVAGPPAHIVATLAPYVAAGVRHVVLRIPAMEHGEWRRQLRELAAIVSGIVADGRARRRSATPPAGFPGVRRRP